VRFGCPIGQRSRAGRCPGHNDDLSRPPDQPEADAPVPPITELTRIEPVHLARLEKQGIFTTGILLEVSETPTRRQSLADHAGATLNDVTAWRDEALMLNLAGFGSAEHQLMIQAGIEGLHDLLAVDLETFQARTVRAASELAIEPPAALMVETWWEQARTLEEA
jgi:hypothetical protein